VPHLPRLVFQCVHSADVADAYARAILGDARGAFNVAAEPPLDANALARLVDARVLPLPAGLARAAVGATWRLRVQPTPSGWLDLALGVPLMDCQRARRELGWHAERSSEDALLELIDGLRHGTGVATPPLEPDERLVPVTRR